VALGNLDACGLSERAKIRAGDWTDGLERPFDLIVANPPYIPTSDLPRLPREVRDFDPWLALDGGIDGLAAYRRILPGSRSLLASDGWLLAECGAEQAAMLRAMAEQSGFADPTIFKDLAGLDRVLAARPRNP
jgi:release factor glutamine methyltransferase